MVDWSPLCIPTTLSVANGLLLGLTFLIFPQVRRSALIRFMALLYLTACLLVYLLYLPSDVPTLSVSFWFFTFVGAVYLPLYVYILSTSTEMIVELLLLKVRPDRQARAMQRWHRKLLKMAQTGDHKVIERKLEQITRHPTSAQLHREMVELYLALNDLDRAVYHAYALVELLPNGHAHALGLYRLAQILADRQNRLESAQPYLRRIIRLYPRSFFASYARRLVNKYEASVDKT